MSGRGIRIIKKAEIHNPKLKTSTPPSHYSLQEGIMKQFTIVATRLLFAVITLLVMAAMTSTAWGQLTFQENFATGTYSVGDSLNGKNGWAAYSGTGTLPEKVVSGNLTYTNYPSTTVGNSVKVD